VEFKVGDRVTSVAACDGNEDIVGKSGEVIEANHEDYLVQFDHEIMCGHEGLEENPKGKDDHCWFCYSGTLKPEEPPC
jgi:hypothetical protein